MRIRNPETSEIGYIENSFKLTDSQGNILKEISLDELKNWNIFEEEVNLEETEKQFIKSCLDNLYECHFNEITHLMREGSSLIFCNYKDYRICFLENIEIVGFKSMKDKTVYSLKELIGE